MLNAAADCSRVRSAMAAMKHDQKINPFRTVIFCPAQVRPCHNKKACVCMWYLAHTVQALMEI